MLHVWYSSRLERLVEALDSNLQDRRDPVAGVFESPCIVVPNSNVQTYLQFQLARARGICAGLDFCFWRTFEAERLLGGPDGARLVDRTALQALLAGHFAASPPGRLPGPVRRYLGRSEGEDAGAGPDAPGELPGASGNGPGEVADDRERRTFQLAAHVARLFDQYQLSRPRMIEAWERGEAFLGSQADPAIGSLADAEAWQRALWADAVAGRRTRGGERLVLPWQVPGEVASARAKGVAGGARVHLFGFSYVSRTHLDTLAVLARDAEVHVYMMYPSTDDPAQGGAGDDLIVRMWGHPGRTHLKLMAALPGCTLHPLPLAAVAGGSGDGGGGGPAGTLLARLQQDIVQGGAADSPAPAFRFDPEHDSSLRIFACPSIAREVEVIAGEIWTLVERGARDADRLRFHEIAVIVADTANLESYQAHIESVFQSLHRIPVSLTDSRPVSSSQVLDAIERLLALPEGHATRPEMMGFLTHPAVLARHEDVDPDRWVQWVNDTGILYGASREDQRDLYLSRDLYNWEQGLRRLALGVYMTDRRSGDDAPVRIGGEAYLPRAIASAEVESLGRLTWLVRSLIADVNAIRRTRASLSEWSVRLKELVSRYVGTRTADDETLLARSMVAIDRLAEADLTGAPMSWVQACGFARDALARLSGDRGPFLAGGVVVSSFLPMRPIPCRAVFIAGLGEGRFPARPTADPLDVTRAHREPGDVEPTDRDRYVFLETLVSARETLRLSYVSRDGHTGEELGASSLVKELCYLARSRYLDDDQFRGHLIQEHPLRRWDPWYFEQRAASGPASGPAPAPALAPASLAVSPEAHLEAHVRWRLRASTPPPAAAELASRERAHRALRAVPGDAARTLRLAPLPERPPAPERDRIVVSTYHLRRFLENPVEGWAASQLGLVEDDFEDVLAVEDEPFEVETLVRIGLLGRVIEELVQGGDPSTWERRLDAAYASRVEVEELAGGFPTGLFRDAPRDHDLAVLRGWCGAMRTLLPAPGAAGGAAALRTLRGGTGTERTAATEALPPVELVVVGRTTPRRMLRVQVVGHTRLLMPRLDGCIILSHRERLGPAAFLPGLIDYLLLRVAGRAPSGPWTIHAVAADGSGKTESRSVEMTRESAEAYMESVLADLVFDAHEYYLPLEAVLSFLADPGASLQREVEHHAEGRARRAPRFGAVPDAHRYPPPDEAVAIAIALRRIRPLFPWVAAGGTDAAAPGDGP
jgi:exodeoxyribonuclease V gamma subunit